MLGHGVNICNISFLLVIIFPHTVRMCSIKKVFLEISQNSQENTCASLWHRCFPVNFAKFLRATFFTEHLWWLLLFVMYISPHENVIENIYVEPSFKQLI